MPVGPHSSRRRTNRQACHCRANGRPWKSCRTRSSELVAPCLRRGARFCAGLDARLGAGFFISRIGLTRTVVRRVGGFFGSGLLRLSSGLDSLIHLNQHGSMSRVGLADHRFELGIFDFKVKFFSPAISVTASSVVSKRMRSLFDAPLRRDWPGRLAFSRCGQPWHSCYLARYFAEREVRPKDGE